MTVTSGTRRRLRWRSVVVLSMIAAAAVQGPVWAASSNNARIVRDNYGVPHIYADDLGALFFGYGFAVAEDRLFQLEMTRRSVWGTVAEVLGPEYLAFDRRTRQTGYAKAGIRARIDRLAPAYRTMLKAYADGINHFLKVAGQGGTARLPAEFDQLGFRPAPWSPEDIAQLFVGTMATRFSDAAREVENAALLDGLIKKFGREKGQAIFDDLLPPAEDPRAILTIPASEPSRERPPAARLPAKTAPRVAGMAPRGIAGIRARIGAGESEYLDHLDRLNLASKMGSNAWVVGAKRTGNNTAILMGGPQMGFTTPGYVHEVGLHGAGFDVVGATPAGYLPVLFGHNANIAWTSTAGASDLVDVFVETLDPKNPARYRFKGEWREIEAREEVFKVKGGADVKDTFHRTVHGPVMSVDANNGVAYSRARAWEGLELESMAGWIDQTQARTFNEFLAASHRMAVSINWYYADRKGNIGYVHTGRYPVRNPGQDLRLPTPGTGEREWQGFLPAGRNPHAYNPDQGFIANWNNQPAKGWYFAGSLWSHVDHAKSLIDFLASRPVVTVDDVKALNRYASFADHALQFFRPRLLEAVRSLAREDAELLRAANLVAGWNGLREDNDGDGNYDSPGVVIFQAWLTQMLADTFTAAKAGPAASLLQYQPSDVPIGAKVLFRVIEGRARVDYLGGAGPREAMAASFRKAVASLGGRLGSNPGAWQAPVRTLLFRNRNFLQIPQAFHEEPKLILMNRGTQNHLVVLSEAGVKGVNVAPPGESGRVLPNGQPSPHAADQLKLFVDFEYKPLNFHLADVMRAAESAKSVPYRP